MSHPSNNPVVGQKNRIDALRLMHNFHSMLIKGAAILNCEVRVVNVEGGLSDDGAGQELKIPILD